MLSTVPDDKPPAAWGRHRPGPGPKLCSGLRRCCITRVHVIVVGCGRGGRELAMGLDRDGNSVSVIDKDRNAFHELPDGFGGKAILAFGFAREPLEQAGIRDANAV